MKEEFPVGQPGDVVDFKNLLNSLVPIAIGIVSFFIKEKRKGTKEWKHNRKQFRIERVRKYQRIEELPMIYPGVHDTIVFNLQHLRYHQILISIRFAQVFHEYTVFICCNRLRYIFE